MMKKAQVTLFIIVGLVLVIAAVGFFLLQSQPTDIDNKGYLSDTASLESAHNVLNMQIQKCLETLTMEAIDIKGIGDGSAEMIRAFINLKLDECIDFEYITNQGFSIDKAGFETVVVVNEDTILVELSYPMTIRKDRSVSTLDTFSYSIKRLTTERLELSGSGATVKEVRIRTEDEDAELVIPEGTVITRPDGTVADELSLNIVEKNFGGLSNNVVLGQIVYGGIPDGVTFSKPLVLNIKYNPEDLPADEPEENIVVGWLNNGVWVGLPSVVDTENKIVSAKIEHFTNFTILVPSCNPIITNIITYDYGLVYEQTCGFSYSGQTCIEADWTSENGGWHEKETTLLPKILTTNVLLATMGTAAECIIKDWDEDDSIEEEHCNDPNTICYANIFKISASENYLKAWAAGNGAPQLINSDGIKDGSCTCEWYPDEVDEQTHEIIEKHTDCVCEMATQNTYGYESKLSYDLIEIPVYIPNGGGSCIMVDDKGNYEIELILECSSGDSCEAPDVIKSVGAGAINIPGVIFNSNGDGCMWAEAKVKVKGKGIYQEPFNYGCDLPITKEECIELGKNEIKETKGFDVKPISCAYISKDIEHWWCTFI